MARGDPSACVPGIPQHTVETLLWHWQGQVDRYSVIRAWEKVVPWVWLRCEKHVKEPAVVWKRTARVDIELSDKDSRLAWPQRTNQLFFLEIWFLVLSWRHHLVKVVGAAVDWVHLDSQQHLWNMQNGWGRCIMHPLNPGRRHPLTIGLLISRSRGVNSQICFSIHVCSVF